MFNCDMDRIKKELELYKQKYPLSEEEESVIFRLMEVSPDSRVIPFCVELFDFCVSKFTSLSNAKKYIDELQFFENSRTKYKVTKLLEVMFSSKHIDKNKVKDLFIKLTDYEPLTPLTFEDWEWIEIDEEEFQNIRYPVVFKWTKNGKPFRSPFLLQRFEKGGNLVPATLKLNNKYLYKCYIKDPGDIPVIITDTKKLHSNPEKVAEELEKHYDLEWRSYS